MISFNTNNDLRNTTTTTTNNLNSHATKAAATAYIVSADHVSTHNNIRIGGRVMRDV